MLRHLAADPHGDKRVGAELVPAPCAPAASPTPRQEGGRAAVCRPGRGNRWQGGPQPFSVVLPDILTSTILSSLFAAQLAQVSHHKPGVDLRSRTVRWITCQQWGHSISTTGSDAADIVCGGNADAARTARRTAVQLPPVARHPAIHDL